VSATVVSRVEEGGYAYGRETERVDLDTERGNVLLLELTSQVTLDEGGLWYSVLAQVLTFVGSAGSSSQSRRVAAVYAYLSGTAVTDEDQLESGLILGGHVGVCADAKCAGVLFRGSGGVWRKLGYRLWCYKWEQR
jgi:hypothetical protein